MSRSIPANRAERAMAFVLMIPREARMAATGTGGKSEKLPSWRCGLDSRLLVVRHDRDRLLRFLRLGSGFFQDLDLTR